MKKIFVETINILSRNNVDKLFNFSVVCAYIVKSSDQWKPKGLLSILYQDNWNSLNERFPNIKLSLSNIENGVERLKAIVIAHVYLKWGKQILFVAYLSWFWWKHSHLSQACTLCSGMSSLCVWCDVLIPKMTTISSMMLLILKYWNQLDSVMYLFIWVT